MIHPLSDVKSSRIGSGTRVWQYSIIFQNAVIGNNCNICAHTLIENDVIIGNNVTIKSGVYIWDGIRISDDVFIGPSVTFTNDIFPRSKQYPEKFLITQINKGASIGANATILAGVTLGENCMIGAGSVVVKDVPANTVVVGNPAKIIRFIK
ncbi:MULTISPECIES: acyltransferase [Proteus]|uniref:acyltransferase n=1 Tax=Proteus TaxID=583 RepID=UPI00138FA18C|nr:MULTISPECIES: acyltransferase [Proteus]MDM3586032.1 acyltransferase [Proteus mirabilis]MDM3831666.1 acyltransferase [Proteus mirabilis]MEC4045877.1 acyltransferase [Proteus mirabilis]NDO96287.1 N-acetyltransferase [Proteus sp. G4441]